MFYSSKNYHFSRWQRYYELLLILTQRNLKQRYRGSILGIYWSLLNPLIMTVIYATVLGSAFAAYYNNSLIDYVLAAFTGLATIYFFSGSTSQALRSVVSNGNLLNKVKLPTSVFPFSTIAANVFQFTFSSLPLLIIITLINSRSLLHVLLLFLPILSLILLSIGTGFILSSLYVFFRDIPYFYEVFVYSLRIATPVFYPMEIVPDKIKTFLLLNPLAQIIESVRQISLEGEVANLVSISSTLLVCLMICIIGWLLFNRLQSQFMDLL